MKKYIPILLFLCCQSVFAQVTLDSLEFNLSIDTLFQKEIEKLDSIQSAFKFKTDSLQQFYKEPLSKIDLAILSGQHKADSLSSVKLPTGKLKSKMDSLNNLKSKKIAELNQKVGLENKSNYSR